MNSWPAVVIFDFDGVLVNSEPLHFYAFHEVLQHVGTDDYPIGKLDLRVYRHTFQLLQAKAGHPIKSSACLVVEDSPTVIDRLRPEGFSILAVTNSRPADTLQAADWVVEDLQLATVAHAIPQLKLRP